MGCWVMVVTGREKSKRMSEVGIVDGRRGEEGASLSTSNGGQGVPTETATQLDDGINSEKDGTKTVESAHLPKEDDLPESEETAAMEEVSVEQPSTAEGDGETGEQVVASSSEESLRYANPYGTFITGIDINSEEAALKRSQRAARFGLSREEEGEGGGETVEKRQARAKRFGTKLLAYQGQPIKLFDKLPEIPHGDLRSGVIHLHGTDDMSTADVFGYFQAYPPRNIEWINDSSCNAVWEDADSASRALRGLTNQPVALRSNFTDEENQPMETSGPSNNDPMPTTLAEQPEVKVQWHLGVDHPKAKQLLLRYAVEGDVKISGAAQRSNYYRKYGNPNMKMGVGRGRWRERPEGQEDSVSGVGSTSTEGKTWREKPTATDLRQRIVKKEEDSGISNPNTRPSREERTWREKTTSTDLRQRLGKRVRDVKWVPDEAMEIGESEGERFDPLAGLVKRPKPLHSERSVEEIEERLYLEDSEKKRMGSEITEVTEADLRKTLQKKRKKRELKLRVGVNPRLVERTS